MNTRLWLYFQLLVYLGLFASIASSLLQLQHTKNKYKNKIEERKILRKSVLLIKAKLSELRTCKEIK